MDDGNKFDDSDTVQGDDSVNDLQTEDKLERKFNDSKEIKETMESGDCAVRCNNDSDTVQDDASVNDLHNEDKLDSSETMEGGDCCDVGCDNEGTLTITDMPYEIMVHISSYLDPQTIISSLYQVCHSFYNLFSDDRYWKARLSLQFPKPYPIVEREDFNWRKACMERETISKTWSNTQEHFNHFIFREGFFAGADVVHLFKGGQYLAVGSRDRHMNIIDLSKLDPDRPKQQKDAIIFSDDKLHKGWVWSMATHKSDDNTLVTGSWDSSVRLWDVGDGAIQMSSNIRLKSAVLGLHYEPGFIAVGGFDKRLRMFDPREPDVLNNMIVKHYHNQPILSVAADDKYVITSGEDKAYSIYDRRAGKKLKAIPLESFVLDLSYGDGQLWGGDNSGKVYVLDTADGLFDGETLKMIDVGHSNRVTGIHHTDGGIFTCSTDGTVKVVEPTLEPSVINTLTSHSQAVARVSYHRNILATAGTDISVGIWIPKDRTF